tara:strand:- start:241 stop:1308 length:1068 start_codon:yes stop_codon:yes gene_type:complete
MLKNLVSFHRTLGVLIGGLAVWLSITGFLLLFESDYERWRHPTLGLPVLDSNSYSKVLTEIESSPKSPILSVRFPEIGFNAFTVYYKGNTTKKAEKIIFEPISGQIISSGYWYQNLMSFILRMHTQLLLPDEAEVIVGVAGILIVFTVCSGLYFWWAIRKKYPLRFVFKYPKKMSDWMRLHTVWGVIFSMVIIITVSTGSIMVFYKQTSNLIDWVTNQEPKRSNVFVEPQDKKRVSWKEILSVVERTFPEGQLTYYMPGKPKNAVLKFRKRLPGEWHPNGRSFIMINPYDASVMQTIDARNQPLGIQLLEKAYPVHIAFVGGVLYKTVVGVASFVVMGLALSGFLYWRRKKLSDV